MLMNGHTEKSLDSDRRSCSTNSNHFTAKTDIAATFVDDKEFPAKVKMNFYRM